MTGTPSPAAPAQSKRKWYRRWWVIAPAALLGLLFVALVVLTFVPPNGVTVGGVSPNVALRPGRIEAESNLSSSSSVVDHAQALLALRRVLIVNLSDHPVMRQVSRQMAQRLAALPMVATADAFDIASSADQRSDGGRLYDFYLTLDMPKFDERGVVPAGRTVDATIVLSGGQDPWDSHHGVTDQLTPPIVRLSLSANLTHHSVTTGYESAGARHKLMIDHIAEHTAGALEDQFAGWASNRRALGDVPDAMMPAYRPVPDDLPLPASPDMVQVVSGCGLMAHNYTVWTMLTDEPVVVLQDLHRRLTDAGWDVPAADGLGEDIWQRHFRAERDQGARIYEAYQARPKGIQADDGPARIVIEYRDRMSQQELRPTMEMMLAQDDPPLDTLLAFDRCMTTDQSERLTQMLLTAERLATHAHLRMARHLHKQSQDDAAMARLRTAFVLARVAEESTNEIEKLAEDITGEKEWNPDPPTAAELEQMGLKKLEPGGNVTAEAGLGEPVTCYQMPAPDDAMGEGLMLISANVLRSDVPEGVYTLRLSHKGLLSGGGSSYRTPHHSSRPWHGQAGIGANDLTWTANAEEIAEDRFRITLSAARRAQQ